MTGFCGIAQANMLGAYGGESQASFSRNPNVSRRFTKSAIDLHNRGQLMQYSEFFAVDGDMEEGTSLAARAEKAGGGKGVVFVVDWDKLAADHKVEPFDTGDGDDTEEEEAVFNDIPNFDRYIVGLEIDREGFRRYCEMVEREGDEKDRAYIQDGKLWVARFS